MRHFSVRDQGCLEYFGIIRPSVLEWPRLRGEPSLLHDNYKSINREQAGSTGAAAFPARTRVRRRLRLSPPANRPLVHHKRPQEPTRPRGPLGQIANTRSDLVVK